VINVIAATDEEYELIKNRVENQWEFDVGGEVDGWAAQGGSLNCYDGMLIHNCTHFDLAMIHNVFFNASDYTHVVVGIEYQKELMDKSVQQLFFITKSNATYTADKCINGKYMTEGKKDGDIVEVIFDLDDNSLFSGTITGLRFDPYNYLADFKVDYFRCVYDPSLTPEDPLIEVDDENQWYFDTNGSLDGWSTKGHPYTVSNGTVYVNSKDGDPGIIRTVSFNATDYQYMVVGVKYTESLKALAAEMFFITEADPNWAANKGISAKYKITSGVKGGDTVEVKFELGQNANWKGRIIGIRFDPFQVMADYEIDYVRFYKKG
jgi:hypothetical protein